MAAPSSQSISPPRPFAGSLFFFILLVTFFPLTSHASFVLTVSHNDESCVFIRVPSDAPSVVSGNFDVLDDDLSPKPVSVVILDSDLNQLYRSKRGDSEDLFEVEINNDAGVRTSTTRLSLCVQNGIKHKSRDKLDRSVGIDVRVRTASSDETADELKEESTLLFSLTQAISNKLYDLRNHHDYMRNREATHREVSEQTYSLVVRWTVLEAFVLITVCVAQILYLRKFFETKQYI